jgi:ATP-dependent DNA helicase RecG
MQRLSDEELTKLLDDIESDRTERKESFSDPKKVREAVCAFVNDLPNHNEPGVFFIGAKDRDGEPSGTPITDELIRNLADMKTDGNILPLPALTVEKRILKGAEMVVVTLMPSDMPPVRYDGRIWVRTGSRRSIANAQEERILNEKRKFRDQPYDLHPIKHAQLSDLSRAFFEDNFLPKVFADDVLKANNRTYEERLSALKMIYSTDDPVPTVLGLLTLGKSPQDFIPGAYVQFLRIDGTELFHPIIDEEVIKGTFIEVIKFTEMKLKAHNRTAVDISQGPQILTYDYPHRAFQQILYNALMHRDYPGGNAPVRVYWYNDRVEINNPGGPYGEVTVDNFGKTKITSYRNPNIASVFKSLDYVQHYGIGLQVAQDEMKRNGNPPLEFDVDQGFVNVIIRGKKW